MYNIVTTMTKKATDIETTGIKIGIYIKYQREKKKYSLSEFARITDLDTSFLLRLENGVYKSVKLDVLQKLALGFNMSLEDFMIKCKLIQNDQKKKMPTLEYYLKEKYQLPDEAIEDVKIMINVLENKYKDEIALLKKKHQKYWKTSS
jgi:transcriptional regulator with XRE-family HTH domain